MTMHMEKYKATQVASLVRHNERRCEAHSNKDIDVSRTKDNYNLCEYSAMEHYKQRLSEVKVQKRKDVNTVCEWVATAPKGIEGKEEERFFKETYNFLVARYGKENTVWAWVHKDEGGRPHLHFGFIPVTLDKKKGLYKVSAKEVVNRHELQTIHKDYSKAMQKEFGRDIGVLNGATAGGNKTVQELKNTDLIKQNERLEAELQQKQSVGRLLNRSEVKRVKRRKTLFHKDKVLISEADLKNLEQTAQRFGDVSEALSELERSKAQFNEDVQDFNRNVKRTYQQSIDEKLEEAHLEMKYKYVEQYLEETNQMGSYKRYSKQREREERNKTIKQDYTKAVKRVERSRSNWDFGR